MIKHLILLIGASIASFFFKTQLIEALRFLVYGYNKLTDMLAGVFSTAETGQIIHQITALLVIPIVIGGVLSLLHFAIKKHAMPHTLTVVWVLWAVLLTAVLTQTGLAPIATH